MTSREFCYFMQGVLDGGDGTILTSTQIALIRQRLVLVFANEPANTPIAAPIAAPVAAPVAAKPSSPFKNRPPGARC